MASGGNFFLLDVNIANLVYYGKTRMNQIYLDQTGNDTHVTINLDA